MALGKSFRVALVQLAVGKSRSQNVKNAVAKIAEASSNKANLIILPECFDSLYGGQYFAEYADTIPGEVTNEISAAAKKHNVRVIAGSIPEKVDSSAKLFNTLTAFNTNGDLVCKFRKGRNLESGENSESEFANDVVGSAEEKCDMAGTGDDYSMISDPGLAAVLARLESKLDHCIGRIDLLCQNAGVAGVNIPRGFGPTLHLFDIDVPGGIRFIESDTLTSGEQPVLLNSDPWNIGVGICYDIRFPELSRIYRAAGSQMLVYPSAFNMTTGPLHWDLLAKAQAVQNQCYVALCSPARDSAGTYVAWGHSMVVDPWGHILASADEGEEIIYADVDLETVDNVRKAIPIGNQRRTDIYNTTCEKKILNVEF